MAAPENEVWLRARDVAAMFHVSAKTVASWSTRGVMSNGQWVRLPHVRTLGRHRRYPRSVIQAIFDRLDSNGMGEYETLDE